MSLTRSVLVFASLAAAGSLLGACQAAGPYFCNVQHPPNQPSYAISPDGRSVAISHRRGVAVWDIATDLVKLCVM